MWAGKKLRWVYGGGLLILLLSEFVEFQPNNYDNNKLLFIWHLLGCILVANLIVDLLKKVDKNFQCCSFVRFFLCLQSDIHPAAAVKRCGNRRPAHSQP